MKTPSARKSNAPKLAEPFERIVGNFLAVSRAAFAREAEEGGGKREDRAPREVPGR